MANIIEDFYYGNIEPQEVNSELTSKLKNKLSNLAEKEEQFTARLNGEDKELFQNYVSACIKFSTTSNADSFISGLERDLHTTHLLRIRKDDKIMANITYRQVNDYLIPNLILPPEETSIYLGKWGTLYKTYLEKHKEVLFNLLLMQGKLYQHCAEVENLARNMFDTIVEQMKKG